MKIKELSQACDEYRNLKIEIEHKENEIYNLILPAFEKCKANNDIDGLQALVQLLPRNARVTRVVYQAMLEIDNSDESWQTINW